VGFGGDAWRGPEDGIELVFGATAEKTWRPVSISFEGHTWGTYDPVPAKSLRIELL
jgi:hypothetical protein